MPRHKSSLALYNQRLRNLAKARAVRQRNLRGGARKRGVRSVSSYSVVRQRHYRKPRVYRAVYPSLTMGKGLGAVSQLRRSLASSGSRKRRHRRPRVHYRRPAIVGGRRRRHRRKSSAIGGARKRRYHRRGGFNPLVAHGILQQVKPFSNGEKIADALGVTPAISRFLDKSGFVGKALRGVASFAKNTLGYGRQRRHRRKSVIGGKRRRHRRIRY